MTTARIFRNGSELGEARVSNRGRVFLTGGPVSTKFDDVYMTGTLGHICEVNANVRDLMTRSYHTDTGRLMCDYTGYPLYDTGSQTLYVRRIMDSSGINSQAHVPVGLPKVSKLAYTDKDKVLHATIFKLNDALKTWSDAIAAQTDVKQLYKAGIVIQTTETRVIPGAPDFEIQEDLIVLSDRSHASSNAAAAKSHERMREIMYLIDVFSALSR